MLEIPFCERYDMSDRSTWITDRLGREEHALVITLDRPCTDIMDLGEHHSAVPPIELSDDGFSVTYQVIPEMDIIDGDVLRFKRDPKSGRIQLDRGPVTKGKIALLTEDGYIDPS